MSGHPLAVIRERLPLPPSANVYWRPAPRRGLVPSDEAKDYKAAISRLFAAKGYQPVVGRARLCVQVVQRNARADLGNVEKVLSDALNGWGWLDDSQLDHICLDRLGVAPEGYVDVVISGERFASAREAEDHRLKVELAARQRRKTTRENRASREASGALLDRARAAGGFRGAVPAFIAPPKPSRVESLAARRPAKPLEVHQQDCLSLFGKGASCTCGATSQR